MSARDFVIALGSNLGDREGTLRAAVRDIAAIDRVTVTAVSGLVESHAIKTAGVDETAPSYLNGVLLAVSERAPLEVLGELQRIELEHGRVREERWGDRTLDLDIIAVDGLEDTSERLILPHPRAWQRAFVLAPWLQLDPDAEIPGRGRVAKLLAAARLIDGADTVWDFETAPLLDSVER